MEFQALVDNYIVKKYPRKTAEVARARYSPPLTDYSAVLRKL